MRRCLVPILLLVALSACQRERPIDATAAEESAPPSPAQAASPVPSPQAAPPADGLRTGAPPVAMPPPDAPTPDIAPGASIVYTCEDGSEPQVRYGGEQARLVRADGSEARLTRTGSGGGGELYVDGATRLHRLSNMIEIVESGKTRRCTESGGNA